MEPIARQHPEFITITCLEWKHILADDRFKDLIIESLRFLTKELRIIVYGFVIMINHFHLIWQMKGEHARDNVQRDFLKFTGQQILKHLRNENSPLQEGLLVSAQVWERNSLGIPLWSTRAIWGKLDYIHNNPVRAGLCKHPCDYKYSSARFYMKQERTWDFLVHIDG